MVKGMKEEVLGEDCRKCMCVKKLMGGLMRGSSGKKGLMSVEEGGEIGEGKMMGMKGKKMEKEYGAKKVGGEKLVGGKKKKGGVVSVG